MSEIQSVNHGVRAWTREDHPGQGKAIGHTKNKFSDLMPPKPRTEPVDTAEISTPLITVPVVPAIPTIPQTPVASGQTPLITAPVAEGPLTVTETAPDVKDPIETIDIRV